MKKKLRTPFQTRQYMVSKDLELYYYNDSALKHVARHAHDYYEFYFFLEGDVEIQIEDRAYPLSYGDVILIPPGLRHNPLIHSTGVPYRRFVFWISQEFYDSLTASSASYGYLMECVNREHCYIFHNDRVAFNAIQSRLIRLIEELQNHRFGREAQIFLDASDLILYLNRTVHQKRHPGDQPELMSLYQNLCDFIEEHIDEDLSLERLSREFFVSKYHVGHVFTEHMGLSIHQYIIKKRLDLCRQAILGDMSITEAYQAFGFGDYSSFYRAFKREYGLSPREFQDMKYVKERETGATNTKSLY